MGYAEANPTPPAVAVSPPAVGADHPVVAALASLEGMHLQALRAITGEREPLAPMFCRWLAGLLFEEAWRRSHGEGKPSFTFPDWEPGDVARGLIVLQNIRSLDHPPAAGWFLVLLSELLIRFAAVMLDPTVTADNRETP